MWPHERERARGELDGGAGLPGAGGGGRAGRDGPVLGSGGGPVAARRGARVRGRGARGHSAEGLAGAHGVREGPGLR
ncbi:hypothetical protein SGPA1_12799 [Streptomyces misionensis JCM 4497]